MALGASPTRGDRGEVLVIPRRSFYAVSFAVALLVLTSLGLGVSGFVYLLRQVEHLKAARCACGTVKRDVEPHLSGETEPPADRSLAAAGDQLSAILRNVRGKRNLPPSFDIGVELPDVVRDFLGQEAEESRDEDDSAPAGDPPLSRAKRGGGGGKKGGRGKKGFGLKAAHIQGNAGGPVAVGADADPIMKQTANTSEVLLSMRDQKRENGHVNQWKTANWMVGPEYQQYSYVFRLNPEDGSLMVTESGLYFVYSQVYYYDGTHAFISHIIRESGEQEPFLQCIQSPVNESRKYNTCFTAGVFQLDAGDKISLELQQETGVVDMSPDTTFFGLIKIAEPRPIRHNKKNKKNERGKSG
ncbi:hypothetical protein Bbelb_077810 [Branchiostoma belcheri]|nr:hypothetical protein Bbelb_077810 [Branchiostoma belcheri]